MPIVIRILLIISCSLGLLQAQTEKFSRVKISLEGKEIRQLAELGIETEHGLLNPGQYFVHELGASEIDILRTAGFSFEILIDDLKAHYLEQLNSSPPPSLRNEACAPHIPYTTPANYTPGTMGGYFRYEEMLANIDQMAAAYPTLFKSKAPISQSLTTIEGRPIYYVKISDNPIANEDEPEVLYSAVHHAREPNSMSQMIYYLWYLLENYETDPEIKYLVDNTEMYFIPCFNPDGYIYNETTDPQGGGYWRKNRRNNGDGAFGVDLNRNYGYLWGYDDQGSSGNPQSETYRGSAPFSEPETQMMRDFCNAHEFQVAYNYHTFSNLLIHSWGYQPINTEDETTFANISHLAGADNFYLYGNSSVLYTVNGSSDDWMYGEQTSKPKILAFTPEVGSPDYGFWPPSWLIERYNSENVIQNLTAARVVHNYAIATETNPFMLEDKEGYFSFNVKKYGLAPGNLTVSLNGISNNITSTGAPAIININTDQVWTEAIAYTLDPTITYGEELKFVLSVDNGLYAYHDTIIKQYGINFEALNDPINNNNGWETNAGYWTVNGTNPHSGPNSFVSQCCSGINEIVSGNPIDLTEYADGKAWLTYWVRWDIRLDNDYAQVAVSSDGVNFDPLCGQYTVLGSGNQPADEPVYQGYQPVWVQEKIDITPYLGGNLYIKFLYYGAIYNGPVSGFYFDDVAVTVLDDEPLVGVLTVSDEDFMLSAAAPNPADQAVRLTAKGNLLQVFDMMGRLQFEKQLQPNNAILISIPTDTWSNGTYICRVLADGRPSAQEKIIIHH